MLSRPRPLQRIRKALEIHPVAALMGPRQCGKTTLAQLVTEERGGTYVTLDDDATREAVLADPITFLVDQRHPLTVDEVQLGGDRLVRAVKQLVDADATPGRFLLTGSTNFLAVPSISESLAGRVRILRLWPLSEAELANVRTMAIDQWFEGSMMDSGSVPSVTRTDYLDRACRGGYPEVVNLDERHRHDWFDSYVETVTQRDLVALADIRKTTSLRRLLRWSAAITSNELNVSEAARDLGIDRATVVSYLEWLQVVFLVHELPAWSRNLTARASRRPKLHLTDTGLAADLLGVSSDALAAPTAPATGPLLESFVVNEIARELSSSPTRIGLFHYRDHREHEVDLILERSDGAIIAIEVKATSSPTAGQLGHVEWLKEKVDAASPGRFQAGILLHTGTQSVTVGDRLHLRPISVLWSNQV